MDAIEFNKTLAEAHIIGSKLAHQKKCLLNAEIWASKKHTTVKLLHCSLNSINEDSIQYSKVSKMLA
jgi:hypothetical protein